MRWDARSLAPEEAAAARALEEARRLKEKLAEERANKGDEIDGARKDAARLEAKVAETSAKAAEALAKMVFYNCGPAPMIHASEAVQKKHISSDRIFSAIDYLTKCGVGICGACASPDGRRICVDGPFITDGLTESRAASG